jgi:hypothetical protein
MALTSSVGVQRSALMSSTCLTCGVIAIDLALRG